MTQTRHKSVSLVFLFRQITQRTPRFFLVFLARPAHTWVNRVTRRRDCCMKVRNSTLYRATVVPRWCRADVGRQCENITFSAFGRLRRGRGCFCIDHGDSPSFSSVCDNLLMQQQATSHTYEEWLSCCPGITSTFAAVVHKKKEENVLRHSFPTGNKKSATLKGPKFCKTHFSGVY